MKINKVFPALMQSASNVRLSLEACFHDLLRLSYFITTSHLSRYKNSLMEKLLNHLNLTLDSVDLTCS